MMHVDAKKSSRRKKIRVADYEQEVKGKPARDAKVNQRLNSGGYRRPGSNKK